MNKSQRLVAALAIAALGVSACGDDDGADTASPNGQAGNGSDVVQLPVGVLASLTGPGSSFGVPFRDGLELCAGQVQESEANVSFELDVQDDASDPATAVTGFNKFNQQDYPVVLNAALTPIAKAVAPIANSEEVLFISGAGSELPNDAGYSFRLADLGTPMKTLGTEMYADGIRRVAAIVDANNPSFESLASAFEASFKEAGGEGFVANEKITSGDADFSSVLTKLREANPDAILLSALPEQSGNIIRQVKQFGGLDDAKMIGTVAWGPQVYDVAQDAAEGAVFAAIWAPGSGASGEFEEAYRSEYNTEPVAYSAVGCQVAWLLAAAAQEVASSGGEVTPEALRDALPGASTSELVQENGPIPGFEIADAAATYPGALAEFQADGSIKAAG